MWDIIQTSREKRREKRKASQLFSTTSRSVFCKISMRLDAKHVTKEICCKKRKEKCCCFNFMMFSIFFWVSFRVGSANWKVLKKFVMDHNSGNFPSPWAAVLGHHSMTPDTSFAHHGLPMDLHVSQGFSYYRWLQNRPNQLQHKLHLWLTSVIISQSIHCDQITRWFIFEFAFLLILLLPFSRGSSVK